MSLLITPETKVGALLDAYPGIEKTLIKWVPAFSKLENPILRKTVAKIATLDQAAKIAGIHTRELVQKLREATGQTDPQPDGLVEFSTVDSPEGPPAWLDDNRVLHRIDADSMLALGEHPIGKVRQCAAELRAGEIVLLTSSFRPAPLIDSLARSGLAVYSAETAPGRHSTWICHNPNPARS